MPIMRLLATLGLLSSTLVGCSAPQGRKELPEITSESEEGYYDLVFSISGQQRLPDGTQLLRALGVHHGNHVGIEFGFGPVWRQDSMGNVPVYIGTATYRSIGAESDQFLTTLDQLYGTGLSPKIMNKETVFSAITLEGNPNELARGPVKVKLFYDTGAEDRYAELYTNVDLKARTLHIDEKDEDYRAAIIQALRQP